MALTLLNPDKKMIFCNSFILIICDRMMYIKDYTCLYNLLTHKVINFYTPVNIFENVIIASNITEAYRFLTNLGDENTKLTELQNPSMIKQVITYIIANEISLETLSKGHLISSHEFEMLELINRLSECKL